jgi:replication fork clamp-binding protein CrfC
VCCCCRRRAAQETESEDEEDEDEEADKKDENEASGENQNEEKLNVRLSKGIFKKLAAKANNEFGVLMSQGGEDPNSRRYETTFENDDALSDEDIKEDKMTLTKKNQQKKKASINFYSYEFDHIIKGRKGA